MAHGIVNPHNYTQTLHSAITMAFLIFN